MAKARADITYWPLALELGVELRTRSRVYEIASGPDGRVTGASYFDSRGVAHHQPARAVIVACNGIGTPRLLLLSRSDSHPSGLANRSGQVGKNLMFHVIAHVTAVFEKDLESYRGPGANIVLSHEFYETDPRRDYVRGYQLQMVRGSGPASTAVGRMMQAVPWGKNHHESFAARFGKTVSFAVTAEDLPEETNKVDLDEAGIRGGRGETRRDNATCACRWGAFARHGAHGRRSQYVRSGQMGPGPQR